MGSPYDEHAIVSFLDNYNRDARSREAPLTGPLGFDNFYRGNQLAANFLKLNHDQIPDENYTTRNEPVTPRSQSPQWMSRRDTLSENSYPQYLNQYTDGHSVLTPSVGTGTTYAPSVICSHADSQSISGLDHEWPFFSNNEIRRGHTSTASTSDTSSLPPELYLPKFPDVQDESLGAECQTPQHVMLQGVGQTGLSDLDSYSLAAIAMPPELWAYDPDLVMLDIPPQDYAVTEDPEALASRKAKSDRSRMLRLDESNKVTKPKRNGNKAKQGKSATTSKRFTNSKEATPKKQQLQCQHCHQVFRNASQHKKHDLTKHDRRFPCTFSFAGCTLVFGSKNEWKRHVNCQHMQLYHWKCDYNVCKDRRSIFNRRDLFGQHIKRMHSYQGRLLPRDHEPLSPHRHAEASRQSAWQNRPEGVEYSDNDEFSAVQDRCMVKLRPPPQECNCEICGQEFSGPKAFETKMEHVGKHYEQKEETGELHDDRGLIKWALEKGLIIHVEDLQKSEDGKPMTTANLPIPEGRKYAFPHPPGQGGAYSPDEESDVSSEDSQPTRSRHYYRHQQSAAQFDKSMADTSSEGEDVPPDDDDTRNLMTYAC